MSDTIHCPKCAGETMAQVTVQEVEVDRCPRCGGLWFDVEEHERLRRVEGSETVDVAAGATRTSSREQVLDCPRCHTRMVSTHVPDQPHIVVETCPVCYGLFFDAGEFADLKHMTLRELLRHWLRP